MIFKKMIRTPQPAFRPDDSRSFRHFGVGVRSLGFLAAILIGTVLIDTALIDTARADSFALYAEQKFIQVPAAVRQELTHLSRTLQHS